MNYSVVRGSKDYIYTSLTDSKRHDITDLNVEVAVHRGPVGSWVPALWEDGAVRSADPMLFSMPIGIYDVTVRLTSNPEIPFVRVGQITVHN